MAMASCVSAVAFGAPVTTVEELTAAIAAASDTEPSEIELAATTFELTAQITISKPITLKGVSRESTIVTRKSGSIRLFEIKHADAVLKCMTVQNGSITSGQGANILLTAGTVEDCIIQDGLSSAGNGQGGSNISIGESTKKINCSGTIRNCIIRRGTATKIQGYEDCGYAVWCYRTVSAVIEDCQIYDNLTYGNINGFGAGGAIGIGSNGSGVKIRRCTFVRNSGPACGAIYSANAGTVVEDCLFARNRPLRNYSTYNDLKGSFAAVTRCAFDTALPSSANAETCVAGDLYFKDEENDDFTPLPYASVAIGIAADGKDAGAIQHKTVTSPEVYAVCDITAPHAVPFAAAFKGYAGGVGSDAVFTWDFGDGSDPVTGETPSHQYTKTGDFTVSVTVSSGGTRSAPMTLGVTGTQRDFAVETVAGLTAALAAAGDGSVITLAVGDYSFTAGTAAPTTLDNGPSAIVLNRGVTLRGGSSDPSTTTLKISGNTFANLTSDSRTKRRVVRLSHPEARLENVTLFGGNVNGTYFYGGGCFIDFAGGTVSNCVVTCCSNFGNQSGGGGIGQYGGLVTHCWITNNYSRIYNTDASGGNVLLWRRAVMRNSLVSRNDAKSTNDYPTYNVGGVGLYDEALLESCSVCGNTAWGTGGVRQYADTARVLNCQIQANASSATSYHQYRSNSATGVQKFDHCACSEVIANGNKTGVVCVTGPLPVENADAGDYRPAFGSVALDAGAVQGWMAAAQDLQGNPRTVDDSVDAGCYQYKKSAVNGSFQPNVTAGACPLEVAFTASVEVVSGTITGYVWHFGDELSEETQFPFVMHKYMAIGEYAPTLDVLVDGKPNRISYAGKITVGPAVMYVTNETKDEDGIYPYGSWADATTNLQTALNAAVPGSKIVLKSGLHETRVTVDMASDITISGETDDPTATELRRICVVSNPGGVYRTFHMHSSGARVQNLTISGGRIDSVTSTFGANVYIEGNGGTLSNCVIKAGQITHRYGQPNGSNGVGVSMGGGLVTHCIFRENSVSLASNDGGDGGGILRMDGGRCEFCLFENNTIDDSALLPDYLKNRSTIIRMVGGTFEHCTVVSNDVARGWTVASRFGTSSSLRVCNCVIAENAADNESAFAKCFKDDVYAQLDHCFGDAEYAPANPAKYVYDRELSFREYGDAKWLPSAKSLAARRAAAKPETVGAKYLDGTPVPAKHAAAGCYPSWGRIGLMLQVR